MGEHGFQPKASLRPGFAWISRLQPFFHSPSGSCDLCREARQKRDASLFAIFAVLLAVLIGTSAAPVAAAGAQFVYDAGGRLIQVIAPNGSSSQYVYDPAGNVL